MIDYSKNISKSNILDVEINRKSFVLPEGRPFSGLEGEFVQIFRYPVSYEMHTKETLAAVELTGLDWKLGGTQWLPASKFYENPYAVEAAPRDSVHASEDEEEEISSEELRKSTSLDTIRSEKSIENGNGPEQEKEIVSA